MDGHDLYVLFTYGAALNVGHTRVSVCLSLGRMSSLTVTALI